MTARRKTWEQAAAQANRFSGEAPNTRAVVLDGGSAGPLAYVLLRPDQDWMIPNLSERGVPWILIAAAQPDEPIRDRSVPQQPSVADLMHALKRNMTGRKQRESKRR